MPQTATAKITKAHAGRPMDFLGFDGKTYNGRVITVLRRHWLRFSYYVPGIGDVLNNLDLRANGDRITVY